jgi:hypothetical protein
MKHHGIMLIMILFFCACSARVVPTPSLIELDEVPKFNAPKEVSIINSQISTGDIEIGSTGVGMGQIPKTVSGDLHEWTETAVDILKAELKKKNVAFPENASKVLKLAITKVDMEGIVFLGGDKCTITLKVVTGDGVTRDFEEENIDTKRGVIGEVAYGAIAKAVISMLKDDRILSYLQE